MKPITLNKFTKNMNKKAIYEYIHTNNSVTKQELQYNLKLSLPTINLYIKELLEEDMIIPDGHEKNTGGRNSIRYSMNARNKYSIGLDITRNHITAVLVDLNGTIVEKLRVRQEFSRSEAYYTKLGEIVQDLVARSHIEPDRILGVGIGVPGLTNSGNDEIVYGEILNFTGATSSEFSKFIPYETRLYNDANAAGFAEMWINSYDNATFYIMLSNNVGGSVLIDRKVYSGNTLKSGEVGHITLFPEGRPCYCGQKGCVDAYCSASVLSNLTDSNLDEFFQRLKTTEVLQEAWDSYCDSLARTINNLRMLFDCDVILGGYVGVFLEEYMNDIRARVQRLNSFHDKADFIKACKYKNEAIATGAALPFVDEFITNQFIAS
ncbi:ROK family transcriptional regulator [Paenibacillus dakarensis]|uniref:ROK family transcriptional regulator n=1 Tax=Paenibacillus dakarensis TaxID=1527293 RepID=UPI000B000ED0|nr:ROK family transcriptional regulator [Paenibacillus dakarensis]